MDSIKAMQPKDFIIPENYFTYAGIRDYYRMPLIYPYSLTAIDILDYGTIENESGVKYFAKESKKSEQIIHNIRSFAFDENMLIAECSDRFTDNEVNYIALCFENGTIQKFDNKPDFDKYVSEQGLDTDKNIITVQEYYDLFLK